MANHKISIKNESISLFLKNSKQNQQKISDLESFYSLISGSEMVGNNSNCDQLVFKDEMWLIPEFTSGSDELMRLFEQLNKESNKAFTATLDNLPYSWRTTLFILPSIEPNLQVLPRSEFDKIKGKLMAVEYK
ncbi:hypothetical protein [Moritella sp. 28]|uniref:hypothetical protein n=1 Tax=Moritella sp. 28 TaxID=2746232 RepID=UPI001BA50D11|nr:hypothetical protein [Moritella sp. 28]QUM85714.1 hypothetical protein HWV02_14935 [Moritella sp. 28]